MPRLDQFPEHVTGTLQRRFGVCDPLSAALQLTEECLCARSPWVCIGVGGGTTYIVDSFQSCSRPVRI